jgi:tRNA1(Val) A37 N6-methylase TrmN6
MAAGLARETADHVITNPPFWSAHAVRASTAPARVAAHVQDEAGLEPWIRAANAVLKPAGTLTLIYPAEGLDTVLALLPGRFGQALVFPLFPRAGQPAHRVLVRAVKGARPRLQIRQGLVLHGAEGSGWSAQADAINRDAAGLDLEA